MGSMSQEIIVTGILAAYAAHPHLIPPQLVPCGDSDPNHIYPLPTATLSAQAIVVSASACAPHMEGEHLEHARSKKSHLPPRREPSLR
jgi:hypothetical protein